MTFDMSAQAREEKSKSGEAYWNLGDDLTLTPPSERLCQGTDTSSTRLILILTRNSNSTTDTAYCMEFHRKSKGGVEHSINSCHYSTRRCFGRPSQTDEIAIFTLQ